MFLAVVPIPLQLNSHIPFSFVWASFYSFGHLCLHTIHFYCPIDYWILDRCLAIISLKLVMVNAIGLFTTLMLLGVLLWSKRSDFISLNAVYLFIIPGVCRYSIQSTKPVIIHAAYYQCSCHNAAPTTLTTVVRTLAVI